jgi:hypothetical protein
MYNFSQGDISWTIINSIIEIADYQVTSARAGVAVRGNTPPAIAGASSFRADGSSFRRWQ